MEQLEVMDEIRMDDLGVVEEIELDEDGDQINRIISDDNIHSFGRHSHLPDDHHPANIDYIHLANDNHVDLCTSNDSSNEMTVSNEIDVIDPSSRFSTSNWTNCNDSSKSGLSLVQSMTNSRPEDQLRSESLLRPTVSTEPTSIIIKSPLKNTKSSANGDSLLKSDKNDTSGNEPGVTESWADFTGLKFKQFTTSEMDAFKKPFEMGWRRELVLRGTVTSTGKKIGDVYYFSPDKNVKLRSYVEMGLYLKKHPDCGLEPENFTFARQPIFKHPYEVVRHAAPRSRNESSDEKQNLTNPEKKTSKAPKTSDANHNNVELSSKSSHTKRKRNAPSRFEDEDHYEQSPFKKKTKFDKDSSLKSQQKLSNGTSKASLLAHASSQSSSSSKKSAPETSISPSDPSASSIPNIYNNQDENHKPVTLSHSQPGSPQPNSQISKSFSDPSSPQKRHSSDNPPHNESDNATEENKSSQENFEGKTDVFSSNEEKIAQASENTSDPTTTNQGANVSDKPKKSKTSESKPEKRKRKSRAKVDKPEKTEKTLKMDKLDASVSEEVLTSVPLIPPAPCSIMCNGKKGMLPNLLCGRCLCLFHPECVPSGIYLDDPHRFICPNCIQPSDMDRLVTPLASVQMNGSDLDLAFESRPFRAGSIKGSNFFGFSNKSKPYPPLSDYNAFPPYYDHRLSYHSRMSANFNRSSGLVEPYFPATRAKFHKGNPDHRPFPPHVNPPVLYPSIPLPPIGPIKYSPNQVAEIIQEHLNKQRAKLSQVKSEINSLTNGYECLLHVFRYFTVRELVKVKQVSRTFNSIASQPSLWKKIKLRGLVIKDWQYFGRNIIENGSVLEVDFEGMRWPQGSDYPEVWTGFGSIIDFLRSVKVLRFGTLPTSVVDEIIGAAVTDNPYNSFSNLETLEVRNLFDDDSPSKQCNLSILEQMGSLKSLRNLHLDCKAGLIIQDNSNILDLAFSNLTNLRSLSMTTLKGLNAEQFSFLAKLNNLESLEIGSCESWTNFVGSSNEILNSKETNTELNNQQDEEHRSKSSGENSLQDGFRYLCGLTKLKRLKLCDVIIDETSNQLSLSLKKMKDLRSLCIHGLTISPDASPTLNLLLSTIKTELENLNYLTVVTDSPYTNKCVFELLKRLDNLDNIVWKVCVNVEDSGECFIPFLKERGEESDMELDNVDLLSGGDKLEMMELDYISNLIRSHLSHTHVEIIPQ